MDGTTNRTILEIVIQAVDQATAVLGSVAASMGSLTGAFGLASIAVGTLSAVMLVHGVGAATKFQDTMELVHTQAGATQKQVDDLSKSVENLAMSPVGVSAEDLARGLYHVESAMGKLNGVTLSNARAMDILKVAAEGVRVGHAQMETVTNGLLGVMAAFPRYLNDATGAMAFLNAIVGSGNVRMNELTSAIGVGVLPVFRNAGLTLADFGAAMATATDHSMHAEMAATQLRMTIALIEKPSNAARDALASVGIKAEQLAEDLRKPEGLLVAIQDLKTHLENSGKTASEQVGIIDEAFGRSRSSAMINLLIGNLDRLSSKYKQQAEGVHNWSESVNAAESTVAAKWDQLTEVFKTLTMVLASSLLPVFSAIEAVLIPVTQTIASVLVTFPQLTSAIMITAAAFAALNIAVVGGRLAEAAYAFTLRNTLPVISHRGAIINSGVRLFQELIGVETAAVTQEQLLALATAESNAKLDLQAAKAREAAIATQILGDKAALATAKEELQAIAITAATDARGGELSAIEKVAAAQSMDVMQKELLAATTAELRLQLAGETDAELLDAAAKRVNAAETAILATAMGDEAIMADLEREADAMRAAQTDIMTASTVKASLATETAEMRAAALAATQARLAAQNIVNSGTNEALAGTTAAVAASEDAAAIGAEAETVANIGLAASIDAVIAASVMVPIIVATAGLAIGVVAYEKIPALHKGVDDLADRLRTDFKQALTDAGDGLQYIADRAQQASEKVDDLTRNATHSQSFFDDVGASARHAADAFGQFGNMLPAPVKILAALPFGIPTLLGGIAVSLGVLDAKLQEQARNAKLAADQTQVLADTQRIAANTANEFAAANTRLAQTANHVAAITVNYDAELRRVAQNALKPLDAQLQKTDASMKAFADHGIEAAKRLSDGVIAEINKIKTVLASPMPEMKLVATPVHAGVGTKSTDMQEAGPGAGGLVLSPAAEAALNQLNRTLTGLPPQLQSVADQDRQKIEAVYNVYVGKYNAENKRHEDRIAVLNRDFTQKVADDRRAAQQAMDNEQQRYTTALGDLNQTHENHMQTILQNFEAAFQTLLANFQAAQAALQQQAQSTDQMHRDALQALQAEEQARMEAINAAASKHNQDWVDQHKQALLDAYNRNVALENTRYQRELQAIQHHGVVLTQTFDRHAAALDRSYRNQIASQVATYDELVKKLNEAHRLHETGIEQKLKAHIAALQQTLDNNIIKEDAAHARYLLGLIHALNDHVKALAAALNAAVAKMAATAARHASEPGTAGAVVAEASQTLLESLNKLISSVKDAADNALAAFTLATINGGGNLDRLAANAAEAWKAQQRLAEVVAAAALTIAQAAGDFKSVMDGVNKAITDDINKIAGLLMTGQFGAPYTPPSPPPPPPPGGGGTLSRVGGGDGGGDARTPHAGGDGATSDTPYDVPPAKHLHPIYYPSPAAMASVTLTPPPTPGMTQGEIVLEQLVKDYINLQKTTLLLTQAQLIAAERTKDWATVLKIVQESVKKEMETATASLILSFMGMGGSVTEATIQMQKAATEQEAIDMATRQAAAIQQQAMINAAVAAGDLSTAFDLISKQVSDNLKNSFNAIVASFLTGTGDLTVLTAAYKAAKAAEDQLTAANYAAYIAIGDFKDALDITKKTLQTDLDNAMAKYAYDLLNHVDNLDRDSAAIIAAAKNMAIFDAALQKATDIANSIKPASFDQATSATLKVTDEQTKLIASNTDIIKANSDLQVAALNSLASRIEDETAVIAAQADVGKAQADQTIKAIQDSSAINKAQLDVATATDPASLAVAQANLRLAQDKFRFDQMAASAAVAVAQAQVQAAMDKARYDIVDNALKQKVLEDTLTVDHLKVLLQQDQIQLALDQLKILNDIDQALGGGTDSQKLIAEDQAKIAQDNADIARAMQQQALDQAAAANLEAQLRVKEAEDAQAIELAKQAQASIEQTGAIVAANDQAKLDAANAAKSAQQNADNISQTIKDTQKEIHDDLLALLGIEARAAGGLSRLDVTKVNPGSNMMNGWASDVARSVGGH